MSRPRWRQSPHIHRFVCGCSHGGVDSSVGVVIVGGDGGGGHGVAVVSWVLVMPVMSHAVVLLVGRRRCLCYLCCGSGPRCCVLLFVVFVATGVGGLVVVATAVCYGFGSF